MSEEVLKILTIPAEFNENTKAIMRNCAANAGIIDHVDSSLLEFTTERKWDIAGKKMTENETMY